MPLENLKAYHPRKHQRTAQTIEVTLCVKGECGTIVSKDVSEGGMGFDLSTAKNLPPLKVGGIVSTRPVDSPHTSSMIGKIVRLSDTELAIEFVC